MNFVGIPTEDFDTVSEAITFIDSFDTGLDLDTLNPNRSVQTQDDPPSASNDSDGKRSNVNGVKRKRETNYSTRAQQGRKAEIQALRSRAMELETHVEQLKKLRPRVGGRDYLNLTYEAAQIACRRKTATIEYQELQRSEEINCKLKAIVSQQQKLDATLRRIMGLKAFDQENEFTKTTKAIDPRADAKYNTATITKLEDEVTRLYRSLELQFSVGPSANFSTSMKTKHDSVHGDSVEILSTTPLPCPVDSAAQLVWEELTTNRAFARCLKGGQPNSYVKNWVKILEGAAESKQVKGIQFLRKYDEPNRVVIVMSGVITLPNDGLHFRDECWMTITRSKTSPNKSVVQGCGQIFLDPRAGQELSALAALSQAQWKALVEYERDARRQSEETNRRLKQILAHQLDTNKNLRCTLQKQSLLQGIDFVFCNTPTSTYSFTAFENSTAIVNHLESVRIKFDKERGKVAEMKATTSVAGPMEEAAKLVWVEQNGQRPDPQKWARRMRGRKPNSQEKNWILTLTCQSYVKHVKGIQLLQKFEEPNRIVLVRTDLMTLTTEGLQFRDKCLTIITRSNTDPLHASVVRIYEEIYMDPQRGFSARPEDMVYAQNVVLKTLSWKLHECSHRLQDMLVCKFQ
ncbi:hypothetical protein PC112_g13760 [Phytophthora cactorum]|nr:hypothetical protein PC112_g13760 [Phytophthora cactorum]